MNAPVGRQQWTSPLVPLCHSETSQFYICYKFSKKRSTKYNGTIPLESRTLDFAVPNNDSQDSTNPTILSLLECCRDDMFNDWEEET